MTKDREQVMKTVILPILMLIFSAFLINFNCKNLSEPELDRPARPQLIPKSPDEAQIESGIDAVPEGDGIFFNWYFPHDSRIKWIKIYRKAQNEEDFTFLTSVSSLDTFYIDYEIFTDVRYYYYLVSVSRKKVDSIPSDTIYYTLYPKADGLSNKDSTELMFSWHYEQITPIGYLLRLENMETSDRIWQSFVTQIYDNIIEVPYNWDGKAVLDTLENGRKYRWRVDVIGNDLYSGSESNWKLLERK